MLLNVSKMWIGRIDRKGTGMGEGRRVRRRKIGLRMMRAEGEWMRRGDLDMDGDARQRGDLR